VAHFVGRETELAKLKELTRLRTASLVVIKGRRRVGKNRLATEFAKQLQGWRSVVLTGLAPDDKQQALSILSRALTDAITALESPRRRSIRVRLNLE
jgi:AAA+ ATPase superfamily predicted ATPase